MSRCVTPRVGVISTLLQNVISLMREHFLQVPSICRQVLRVDSYIRPIIIQAYERLRT